MAAHAEHGDALLADAVHQTDRLDQAAAGQGLSRTLGVERHEQREDGQIDNGGAGQQTAGAPAEGGDLKAVFDSEAQVWVGALQADRRRRVAVGADAPPQGQLAGREQPLRHGLGDGEQARQQVLLGALVDGARGLAVCAVVARLPQGIVQALGGRSLQPRQAAEQITPGMVAGQLAVAIDLAPGGDEPREIGLTLGPLLQVVGPELRELVAEQAPVVPVRQPQAADRALELTADGVAGQVIGEQQQRGGAHGLVAREDGVGDPVAGRKPAVAGMRQRIGDGERQSVEVHTRGARGGGDLDPLWLEFLAAVLVRAAVPSDLAEEAQCRLAAGRADGVLVGHVGLLLSYCISSWPLAAGVGWAEARSPTDRVRSLSHVGPRASAQPTTLRHEAQRIACAAWASVGPPSSAQPTTPPSGNDGVCMVPPA